MLILLLNMILLPLNIAFFADGNSATIWLSVHTISDVAFIIDVILNFRTGFRQENTGSNIIFVLDPREIAVRYG